MLTVVTQKNCGVLFPLWFLKKICMSPFCIFIIVHVIGLYNSNHSDNNNHINNISSNSNKSIIKIWSRNIHLLICLPPKIYQKFAQFELWEAPDSVINIFSK